MEKIALLELLDRDGNVRQALPVTQWPVTLGRDLECDLVLDDPYVAARHAQIVLPGADQAELPPGLQLVFLDSINGAILRGRQWVAGQSTPVQSGDEWQMGRTRIRLRLAQAALAAEQPLQSGEQVRWWDMAWVLTAILLWTAAETYLRTDPDGFASVFPGAAFAILSVLALWSGLWAFATKLFQHKLVFWRHVWLTGLAFLSVSALDLVADLLAYSLSLEWLGRLGMLYGAVVVALLVNAQLQIVQPHRRTAVRWVAGTLAVLMLASTWGLNWYRQDRLTNEMYLSALFPPALRIAPVVPAAQFLQGAQGMQSTLDKKAKEPVDGVDEVPNFDEED